MLFVKGLTMTQDEIIEMARQSGAMFDHMTWVERDLLPVFERFAKLVAAKEREEIAKLVEPDTEHRNNPHEYLGEEEGILLLDEIAEAIRARGEA